MVPDITVSGGCGWPLSLYFAAQLRIMITFLCSYGPDHVCCLLGKPLAVNGVEEARAHAGRTEKTERVASRASPSSPPLSPASELDCQTAANLLVVAAHADAKRAVHPLVPAG